MDNMAMNDNGVVGELRAITEEKRTKYESPYARGVGVAKKGILTKIDMSQVDQGSNFGGDTARKKIIMDYKFRRRKNRFSREMTNLLQSGHETNVSISHTYIEIDKIVLSTVRFP
jgi:hypothetical protein